MPALISYTTKRGVIFYTPPNSPSTESEVARLPLPPCRPRARRPYSIHITRLSNTTDSSPNKRSSKHIDLKTIFSYKTAKKLLVSALTTLSPKAASVSHRITSSYSEDSERPATHNSPPIRLTSAGIFKENFNARKKRRLGGISVMSRSSIGGNSWRPVYNIETSSGNTTSSTSPRTGAIGIPRPMTLQQCTNEMEKPLVSGNEVSCSIILAEPVIFLMGLDHDGSTRDCNGANAMSLLRGTLRLNVTKNAKIKAVSLKFSGRAKTLWPEGIPPQKQEIVEECSLRTQVIPFFNALYKGSDSSYGDLCNYVLRDSNSALSLSSNKASEPLKQNQLGGFSLTGITNRANKNSTVPMASEGKKMSAPSIQLTSQQMSDSSHNSVQTKGYKVFYPGVYDYSFELPIDCNLPETTNLPLANVKWELEATIERAGAFKPKLVGRKEVPVVRSPSQDSLELVEPIAVSRTWDQQLHYDIVISGKSFPIGTKIPIAFKLTPLAKVQVHKVKVFLSENVEYFARDRSVHRKDIKRRLLLLEKIAGKPVAKEFWPSEVKIVGGERTIEEREMRRSVAMQRREAEAVRNNTHPVPLPESSENILGDIDLGVEEWWGQTEIEMNVQIPTCETMEKDRTKRLSHDCTWSNVNVHHWLKILIRLSRADADDPTKRRHYEISVDSPISLLNCRATQANISLPEYSGLDLEGQGVRQVCGCQSSTQASRVSFSHTSSNEIISTSFQSGSNLSRACSSRPELANLPTHLLAGAQRPIHLMRSPSFLPPPFDAEEPPPPIITPPPLYDNVIGTPSYDGLADYFSRLGEYEGEVTEDEDTITSVNHNFVNVPNSFTNMTNGQHTNLVGLNQDFIFGVSGTNSFITGSNSGVSTP
ncbi:putative arrestin-related trafficking adapter [Erysiphe necator]|uniref:Putative arrestin domain-containing protein n=1 Tax=Uncinula necator TaxID=52586 RepID=A0A0B1NVP6_UNCNE|nr:putative arrestin-related trafficking adapter [Erysiphe necator]KHJ30043.1 putative arrestin domain-containing protein [Erysiphe necator]